MSNNRSKNAIVNVVIIVAMQILSFVYGLYVKDISVREFTLSIYGVLDLFDSFFSSLTLVELGFGTIAIYNLFKPVAENDVKEIEKQLSLSKTVYLIVNLIILIVSLVCSPFIFKLFNISYDDKLFVYIVYFAYVFKTILIYRFMYKASLISAGQYSYVHNVVYLIVDFICFVLKVISIKILHSSYIFAIVMLVGPSIVYVVDALWTNKKYSIGNVKYAPLSFVREQGIFSQYKKYTPTAIYKLAFNSMDNMIISNMLSTDYVAYTTNYNSIFSTALLLARTINASIKGIMADYRNKNNSVDNTKEMFNVVLSLNFIFVALMSVGLYSMIDDLMKLWLGEEYIISRNMMLVCLTIRMIDALFEPVASIFNIEGYMFKEKLPLFLSAGVNFVLTIIFIKKYGLIGAYIATIIALVIKWIGKFYYILSGVFENYKAEVLLRNIVFVILIALEMYFINQIGLMIMSNINSILLFIIKAICISLITCIINLIVISINKDTRKYFKNTILKMK